MYKFSVNRQVFADAVNHVKVGVAVKSTIPQLECLKLELTPGALELTGYDLNFGIQYTIPAETQDTGAFLIAPNLLSGAVSRLSAETVQVTVEDNYRVKLSCGGSRLQLSAMTAEEYPQIPEQDKEHTLEVGQDILKSMVNQTKYATSTSEARPILTGELFELEPGQLHVVAIDGFRLAVRQEPLQNEETDSFVVPRVTLERVTSLLSDDAETPCTICHGKSNVMFSCNGYTVFSRLLEGEFHNYKRSIPDKYETEAIVNTEDIRRSLDRCGLLISGKYNEPVRCTFSEAGLEIVCTTALGELRDTIPAKVSGPDVTIGFDDHFFMDAVRAAETDTLRIQLTGGNRVAKLLPPNGESFIFLLMPIQLRA